MDSSGVTQLLSLFVLILLSAFFSSAETALTTVNRVRVRSLVEQGNKKAVTLSKVIDDSSKMLSAILIGNNIVNITASSIATSMAIHLWGNVGVGIATGIITLLILIFGEISPKTLATFYAEKIALSYAGIIYFLMRIMTPIIFIINKLSLLFLKLFRIDAKSRMDMMTENELRTIVDVSHEEGVIESEERKMIYNVFDFGDSYAKDIMIPRIDMAFADVSCNYEQLLAIFREEMYTRLPVYEDTTDNVIGIVNVKDLILFDDPKDFHLRDILREVYYTYEYKKTSELLVEMRERSINLAIVLDEYGATSGLITLEDLLEEIVGEIRDEYDEEEEDFIHKINETEYILEASMKLDDVNEALDLHFDSEDYDSIGGLIIEQLDHLPAEGESVTMEDGTILIAEKIDKNRIDKVHMYLPKEL